MKILIDDLLTDFQKIHPTCISITWDNIDGVVMSLYDKVYCTKSEMIKQEFISDSPTGKLFIKAQELADDFIGQISDYK